MITFKRFLQILAALGLGLSIVIWFWIAYKPGVLYGHTNPPEFLIEIILLIFFSIVLILLHKTKIFKTQSKLLFIISLIALVIIPITFIVFNQCIIVDYGGMFSFCGHPILLPLSIVIITSTNIVPFLVIFFFTWKYLRWQ